MIRVVRNEKKEMDLTYTFNSEEIILLAKLLRKQQDSLDSGLERFSSTLENVIYNSLSLEEAKKLYS